MFDFILCYGFPVDSLPGIENIGQYERYEYRYIGHGFQCKQAGAAVGYGQ